MPRNLILLAEDDDAWRGTIKERFEQLGFEVREFPDGKTGLAALKALTPQELERAILVTDWVMPEMQGPEVVKQARQAAIAIPMLIWTRKLGEDEAYLLMCGADHAVEKTMLSERMQVAIEATLGKYASRTGQAAPATGGQTPLQHAERPPQGQDGITQ